MVAREEGVKSRDGPPAGHRSRANWGFRTRLGGLRVQLSLQKLKNVRRESSEKRTSRRRRAENEAESHPTAAVCEKNCRATFKHDPAGRLRAVVNFRGLVAAKTTCEAPEPARLSSRLGGFSRSQALQAVGAVMSTDAFGLAGAVDAALRLCVNREMYLGVRALPRRSLLSQTYPCGYRRA